MLLARRFGKRSLAVPLVATALVCGASIGAGRQGPALAAPYVDCRDARWYVGMNIPDARDNPAGDIVRVDAIRQITAQTPTGSQGVIRPRYTLGYRYTLKDGRTYVADRSRPAVTTDSLALMNEVVNDMSKFSQNAFDPRDGGAKVYQVDWSPAVAKRLGLETAACPARSMRG
jgi:hypothetical protein